MWLTDEPGPQGHGGQKEILTLINRSYRDRSWPEYQEEYAFTKQGIQKTKKIHLADGIKRKPQWAYDAWICFLRLIELIKQESH